MSTKIEYICDACGAKGPAIQGWVELVMNISTGVSLYTVYHSCKNVMCMNKVQQKQCNDFAAWTGKQNVVGD